MPYKITKFIPLSLLATKPMRKESYVFSRSFSSKNTKNCLLALLNSLVVATLRTRPGGSTTSTVHTAKSACILPCHNGELMMTEALTGSGRWVRTNASCTGHRTTRPVSIEEEKVTYSHKANSDYSLRVLYDLLCTSFGFKTCYTFFTSNTKSLHQ